MKKPDTSDFPAVEEQMLKTWAKERTFDASLENRRDAKRFSFYDGPPFANGLPHYGHVLALTQKDSITRYKTMRGYYVPRRNGWDTHGLPVEYEVEKQLGISGKRQILELGVGKFNDAARASVFKYRNYWEDFMRRIGRWADAEHSYATMDDDYIESVWWVLGQLHEKGLVYRGFRSNPYCPRCATPLSNFEVNQNYRDNVPDPSVFVKFELAGHKPHKSLLAWTTTPWTLPANAALAVQADAEYVEVEMQNSGDGWVKGERLILAKARLSVLDVKEADYKITNTVTGREMVDKYKPRYEPLYPDFVAQSATLSDNDFRVYVDESVSLEDGTGILHVAPRYGETDLALGQRVGLSLFASVNAFGNMVDAFGDIPGMEEIAGAFFKDADRHIIADLTRKGRIFAAETFEHTYPFCWRCETPLMYFAMPSWFVRVSELRGALVENNEKIHWVPAHIKKGRFGNWLADARDWNFSRNRFWGAPIPIWVNEKDEEDIIVVESVAQLAKLSGHDADFDLHRPGIDSVVIEKDGKRYRRTEEVFDCWFESGSMPYAQDHYPFEHKQQFDQSFPAEFIAEGVDQTRGWFYTLHVLGTALFGMPAFKNVIVNGMVLAADGKKLSKRLRNYPEPNEIFETTGADSLRLFLMSSPVVSGEDVRFSFDAVNEVKRNVFMTIANSYSFLAMYADIDKWQPGQRLVEPTSDNLLDQWLLSRLNETIEEATREADEYQIARAVRPLRGLVDDLSNWYVRRSRRRFWKSDDDGDKQHAYMTLHYVLSRITQLLAPWSPFMSDYLWRCLTDGMDEVKSVHVSDWPEAGAVNFELLTNMASVRQAIAQGLAARAEAKIKVRQPLSSVDVWLDGSLPEPDQAFYRSLMAEEVNVKAVHLHSANEKDTETPGELRVELDTKITPELKAEGLMRDIVRHIQNARKQARLQVDDRIVLTLQSESELLQAAIDAHKQAIMAETLATTLKHTGADGGVPTRLDGEELYIAVEKST